MRLDRARQAGAPPQLSKWVALAPRPCRLLLQQGFRQRGELGAGLTASHGARVCQWLTSAEI